MQTQYPSEVTFEEALRRCSEEEISGAEAEQTTSAHETFIGIGQERFFSAIRTGILLEDSCANVYVAGLSGQNGFHVVKDAVEAALKEIAESGARQLHAPRDWCYVYNFEKPHCPVPLSFPKGQGRAFKEKIAALRNRLEKEVRKSVLHKDIRVEYFRLKIAKQEWLTKTEDEIRKEALADGFRMDGDFGDGPLSDAVRFILLSGKKTKSGARPMGKKESDALAAEEKEKIARVKFELAVRAESIMRESDENDRKIADDIRRLEKEAASAVIDEAFGDCGRAEFGETSPHAVYLSGLRDYAKAHCRFFFEESDEDNVQDDEGEEDVIAKALELTEEDPFLPWQVNLFIDNTKMEGVPVVAKNFAHLEEFAGYLNSIRVLGASHTDHMRIEAGFAARANGGVLIMDVRNFLSVPGLWDTVKNCLKNRQISFETVEALSGFDSSPLRPLPIPMETMVVLFGERELMDNIAAYDDEFVSLFTLRAEVVPFVERTAAEVAVYGAWFRDIAAKERGLALSANGAARLVEYAGRLAGSQERLSTDCDSLRDALSEAALCAKKQKHDSIVAADVAEAVATKLWRANFVQEWYQKCFGDETILIDVSGQAIGQINGLSVIGEDDFSFGVPFRLTAVTNHGAIGVINIHHKAGLEGKIARKADHTVRALLKSRFANDFPLAIEIHFSCEQEYDYVDGDSASVAQYLVMLSSIARIPLRQSIAVTGSLDVLGNIQPIGGATEKIEGFFRVCQMKGALSGEQGVVIPWQNQKNLMLCDDVVAAIRNGKFHVWMVRTLDEALHVLMGKEPAEVEQKTREALKRYFLKAKEFYGNKMPLLEKGGREE